MANELMTIPNWGIESAEIYEEPQIAIGRFVRKYKINYYFLKHLLDKYHKDIMIRYAFGHMVLEEVKSLYELDEYKRFISKKKRLVEVRRGIKSRKYPVLYVVPFTYYEVSRSIIEYMKFKGYDYHRRYFIKELQYILNNQVSASGDFNAYIDDWAARIIYDCTANKGELLNKLSKVIKR